MVQRIPFNNGRWTTTASPRLTGGIRTLHYGGVVKNNHWRGHRVTATNLRLPCHLADLIRGGELRCLTACTDPHSGRQPPARGGVQEAPGWGM
jgi:hypothetical protein